MSQACPRGAILTWLFAALLFGFMGEAYPEEQEAHAGTLENWEMYGSVRVQAGSFKRHKWYLYDDGPDIDNDGVRDSVYIIDSLPATNNRAILQNNSYFGVRGKGEKFGFGFEMGLGAFVQAANLGGQEGGLIEELTLTKVVRQSTMLRKVYGDWYINDFTTLRIGQDWTLTNFFLSNQVYESDAGLGYSGILYTGRHPQLKLSLGKAEEVFSWKGEAGVIKPLTEPLTNQAFAPGNVDGYLQKTEEKMPKFEVNGEFSYKMSDLFSVSARAAGGLTQYDALVYQDDAPNELESDERATIKSHVVGGYLDLRVWKIGLAATYAMAQNPASYGVWVGNPEAGLGSASMRIFLPTYRDSVGGGLAQVFNADIKQWGVVGRFFILPWLTWEAGAGRIDGDHDDRDVSEGILALNHRVRRAYYTNLQFAGAGGHFIIVPEYTFSDFGGYPKTGSREEVGGGFLHVYTIKLELDI